MIDIFLNIIRLNLACKNICSRMKMFRHFKIPFFPKIAFRSYTTSRKIKIKSFDEIKIGDIVSSSRDLKLYRTFAKHTKEHTYTNRLSQYIKTAQWLEGKSIEDRNVDFIS